MRATARRLAIGASLGLALTALAACEIPLPVPTVTPTFANPGAVLSEQSGAILSDTFAELAASDEAKKVGADAVRLGGDAAVVRAAEYVVAAAGGTAPTALPSDILAVYGSDATTWPRVLVAITAAPDATLTPLVLLWVQDDARSEYQLREWAHMAPGAIVPAMANQSIGFTQLPLDAEGFSMTPQAAIDAYVDGLTKGEPTVPVFAPDPYRERMFAARTALTAAAAARSGTYEDKIVARSDQAYVLLTAEGSALVLVPITVTSVFTVPGAQLSLPASDQALLTGTLADRVVHHYSDFVVINVPKDATLLPSIVAADHHLVGVSLTESP